MLDISLLGTGGMMPLPNRWLTALLTRYNGKMILIDCGEGTQITLKMLGWGFKHIQAICFTHYHADHISGLPGMLLTLGNAGREEPLKLIGPSGLQKIVKSLCVIAQELPYQLEFIEISEDLKTDIKIDEYNISALMVDHTTNCLAYRLEIERNRKFIPEQAEKLNIPKQYWKLLQRGEEVIYNNATFTPDMVLGQDRKGFRVTYCTDSRPTSNLVEFIRDSDIFICEGMYGEDELIQKAKERKHMVFSEAATLAKQGNANELWLTHYSPSLVEPKVYLKNTKKIFQNTILGKDRMKKTLSYEE